MTEIRKTKTSDLERVMELFDMARATMKAAMLNRTASNISSLRSFPMELPSTFLVFTALTRIGASEVKKVA